MHRFTIAFNKKKDTLHLRKLSKGQESSNSLRDWYNFYREIENAEYKNSGVLQKTIAFYIIKTTATRQQIYSREFREKMAKIDMEIYKKKLAQKLHKHDQKKVERFKEEEKKLKLQKILEEQKVELDVMRKYKLKEPIQTQRELFNELISSM